MSVVMRAMENAYVINERSRVAFIPRQDRYMFRVFHSMPREKDGLNEASIKSPFIAATGAIRLREQILKLETNASTWTGISIDRAHPSNHLRNPYVPSTLEEASRWPPSKTHNRQNRNSWRDPSKSRAQFTANADTRILRIGRPNLPAVAAWKLNEHRWNIEENCTGMSAVIPLASRSQSTFPRLVFVPRRCARACFLREYCTCRVLAPINGHSRFPFTPRERRNARIGEMASRRVSIVLSLPITSEIIKLRTSRRKLALYRPLI